MFVHGINRDADNHFRTARPDTWRSGGGVVGNDKLTSFHFMDEVIRRLARKDVFPNLKTIVVGGHSAGGQFVIRYEMSNQVHDSVGVPISRRHRAANPDPLSFKLNGATSTAKIEVVSPDGTQRADYNVTVLRSVTPSRKTEK